VSRIAALALALWALAAPARACSLALVLALDISSSVNGREYAIQLGGLAAALRDPQIRAAVADHAPVWVSVFEWSGRDQQDDITGWVRLEGPADMDALAARLDAHRRSYDVFSTAIGSALVHALDRFASQPEPCNRRVIDISGDGASNEGPPPRALHPRADALGVTINALVIKGAFPDPEAYYLNQVIHGPGAFMMVARNGFDDYPGLIRGKLLREIAPVVIIGRR
jgi:Ca-activated chloride channel homolog